MQILSVASWTQFGKGRTHKSIQLIKGQQAQSLLTEELICELKYKEKIDGRRECAGVKVSFTRSITMMMTRLLSAMGWK
ncbi:hypothetical protein CROQUDRAFT_652305 [Cronartium quercuum f. sp. fusiforme G11]|uniref:Uncharacterized protein n=1 Tax=Cronartium quercuum f. sp. fusiforme G11 TaxID=708437 RepID=A0A9P6NQL5_9BASI|nr:hypothetical protein CROQUDRAFT_652305 [Cronartium quercuum f. sp. fusiforme G11]